jgi:hypothetical protein
MMNPSCSLTTKQILQDVNTVKTGSKSGTSELLLVKSSQTTCTIQITNETTKRNI